ncbi:MAG TPA: branched-chain amino acid aminotransferase [Gammaproteobacteria bacterium]|nr:branched-chain amino acid aminotransferase [Gammaproteobacteria bacterium]
MKDVTLETSKQAAAVPPFGTVFSEQMPLSRFSDGRWTAMETVPVAPLSIHPGAHVLHYSSTCFEGLKAFRMPNGAIRVFRLDRHVARFRQSTDLLCLPTPPADLLEQMVRHVVELSRDDVPVPPGALYLRPTMIGTEANIGAAGTPSAEALLYVLASPVGDYFAGGGRALRILIEDEGMRSTPGFGQAKTGGNYASALRHIINGRAAHNADQVLFCPGGDVQETGASNFFLLDDRRLMTKPLDGSFLPGITRDSLITLARHMDYEVIERDFTVDELKDWIRTGEAALSGTAAVLSGVGTFIHDGKEYTVGDGRVGPNTQRLREALTAIQFGVAEDPFGWLT